MNESEKTMNESDYKYDDFKTEAEQNAELVKHLSLSWSGHKIIKIERTEMVDRNAEPGWKVHFIVFVQELSTLPAEQDNPAWAKRRDTD